MIQKYLWIDFIMDEKESINQIEEELATELLAEDERKTLEEEGQWHFDKMNSALQRPGILKCVADYAWGFRSKPTPQEINREYQERILYFKDKQWVWEQKVLKIVIPIVLVLLLLEFVWLWK